MSQDFFEPTRGLCHSTRSRGILQLYTSIIQHSQDVDEDWRKQQEQLTVFREKHR
ncbi:MAG: hypothetical protein NPIRA04_32950 [Nitrospirales bacterium]|nr:MAG: hypothetical protein NPIRA04_32950 [Nitrospirales bacterium]